MTAPLTAPVFNIQTYCIHDGPGIRTTVFLKGCPLRCLWCANPESNEARPQLMTYSNKCTACGRCVSVCPKQAVSLAFPEPEVSRSEADQGPASRGTSHSDADAGTSITDTTSRSEAGAGSPFAVTDRNACVSCGKCVEVCPSDAREIAGKNMTTDEIMKEVLKDKLFLTTSGGGLTLSGGEALSHPDFSYELLGAAKSAGLHTAIETSSFAPRSVIDRVFSRIDLGLLDIKHMDSAIHKKLTGVPNELILDNIQHIYHDLRIPVIIRIPTVPDYNGDMHNIAMTAKFVRDCLGTDVPIHLLPYHSMGESKAESLGKTRSHSFHIPEDSYMETLKSVVESYGIEAQIGG